MGVRYRGWRAPRICF
uniref:Uncharacterized protein n=1 Tax=Arundo donax TaxID=35708 RepID=A0A0A8YSU1_ARUDO